MIEAPAKPKCSIDTCVRLVRTGGLCNWHYGRKQKGLDLMRPFVHRNANKGKVCAAEGCSKPAKTMTLCAMHYSRSIKGIPFDQPEPHKNKGKLCSVFGCDKQPCNKGLCSGHASRLQQHGIKADLQTPLRVKSWAGVRCKFNACDLAAKSSGYCRSHYHISFRYGQAGLDALQDYYENGCGICGDTKTDDRSPAIDHDHSCCPGRNVCGKCVRGALCYRCNLTLGFYETNPGFLVAAARYLDRHSSVNMERKEA